MTYVTNYVTFRNMQTDNNVTTPDKKLDKIAGKIPVEKLLMYALQGKSCDEIAKLTGCSRQNVSFRLKAHKDQIDAYLTFKQDPAALWEYQEYRVLNSVADSDINKARLAEKATFAGIARDKVRLQRGQSTTNIQALTALITSIHTPQSQDIVVSAPAPVFSKEVLPEQEAIDSSTPDHDQPVQAPDPDDLGG